MNTKPNEWVIGYVMNKLSAKYPDITREEIIAEWREMNGIKSNQKGEREYAKVV